MSTPMFDLPEHFGIAVNAAGQGPVDADGPDYHHTECWCGDRTCARWRDLADHIWMDRPDDSPPYG